MIRRIFCRHCVKVRPLGPFDSIQIQTEIKFAHQLGPEPAGVSFRNAGELAIRLCITGDPGAIALSVKPGEILYLNMCRIECPVFASFT
jgi:hypothetical protein